MNYRLLSLDEGIVVSGVLDLRRDPVRQAQRLTDT
jgi:hypothetical protein